MTELVFDQKIDLPYKYTVGRAHRAFLRGLVERKVIASSDGERRYVPARPFAPDGRRLLDLVEVQARGVVVACTTAHHLDSRCYALVRVDGSSAPMLHLLETALEPGRVVEAVWEEASEPGILAIRCFRAAT